MKHIFRWSLMKNSQNESLSVHTLDTAVIAH
ncbi:MAG: 5'-deoxynucleotidase, partial [Oscillospiraceae bacterium]|nr:5'-deoxynucleotidase [Oscillospiraceae bacterium]